MLSFFSSRLYFHSLYFAFSLFFVEVSLGRRHASFFCICVIATASLRLGLCPPRCPPPVRDPSAPSALGVENHYCCRLALGGVREQFAGASGLVARRDWRRGCPTSGSSFPISDEKTPSRARVSVRTVKYLKNTTHNHTTIFFTPLTPLSYISV